MKISVAIPAYNAARTIQAAVESVLCQTLPAAEILVVDDGSTDATASLLRSYGCRLKLIRQDNRGSASARNRAYHSARGDLIAWLDADDLWHPSYLETQVKAFAAYPDLAASFTAHVDFYGYDRYEWSSAVPECPPEVISPLSFLKRYHTDTGAFGAGSFMCVPRAVLASIGDEPFKGGIAADAYFCTWLPLLGPVGLSPAPLGAYRITPTSLSADRVKTSRSAVHVFERTAGHYKERASPDLQTAFESAFASQRRHYAKRLLGVGRTTEAREQLRLASLQSGRPGSAAKSLGLLMTTFMPRQLQPGWPAAQRDPRDHATLLSADSG